MSSVLNRTSNQYLNSVNTPDYDPVDWIINPDLSAVTGFDSKYWIITGDVVTLMDQAARDAVDATEDSARLAAAKQAIKDGFEQSEVSDKAIVLMVIDEVNILRAALAELKSELKANALSNALTYNTDNPRTPAQAKTAFENKVDSL